MDFSGAHGTNELFVFINGQRVALMEDRRLAVYQRFPEGTVLVDPTYSPPQEIPLLMDAEEYGVTSRKLLPFGHYHAYQRDTATRELVPLTGVNKCIYVLNLPPTMTADILGRSFEMFDLIEEADVVRGPSPQGGQVCKGRGWVILQNPSQIVTVPRNVMLLSNHIAQVEVSDRASLRNGPAMPRQGHPMTPPLLPDPHPHALGPHAQPHGAPQPAERMWHQPPPLPPHTQTPQQAPQAQQPLPVGRTGGWWSTADPGPEVPRPGANSRVPPGRSQRAAAQMSPLPQSHQAHAGSSSSVPTAAVPPYPAGVASPSIVASGSSFTGSGAGAGVGGSIPIPAPRNQAALAPHSTAGSQGNGHATSAKGSTGGGNGSGETPSYFIAALTEDVLVPCVAEGVFFPGKEAERSYYAALERGPVILIFILHATRTLFGYGRMLPHDMALPVRGAVRVEWIKTYLFLRDSDLSAIRGLSQPVLQLPEGTVLKMDVGRAICSTADRRPQLASIPEDVMVAAHMSGSMGGSSMHHLGSPMGPMRGGGGNGGGPRGMPGMGMRSPHTMHHGAPPPPVGPMPRSARGGGIQPIGGGIQSPMPRSIASEMRFPSYYGNGGTMRGGMNSSSRGPPAADMGAPMENGSRLRAAPVAGSGGGGRKK